MSIKISTVILWHVSFLICGVQGLSFRKFSLKSATDVSGADKTSPELVVAGEVTRDKNQLIKVSTLSQLQSCMNAGLRVQDIDIRGNTSSLLNTSLPHPVVQAMLQRIESGSIPGNRTDGMKIAIAIEGGGMRGCVGAGMITAVWYLGLEDTVDVVYGSSAGALVGAYFVSRQLPYFGPSIYYDVLSTSGSAFLDPVMLLRSCGLGLLDLRPTSLASLWRDRVGKPVLNLEFVLGPIIQVLKPLDWDTLWQSISTGKQSLKVVCSGLLSKKSIVLSGETNNFKTITEFGQCLKASMLLPGITGDVVRLRGEQVGTNLENIQWKEYTSHFKSELREGSEPLADAQLFEPVPYRSALEEGATHVLVLRTRPDGVSLTKRIGLLEKMIIGRFLGRKLGMRDLVTWMHTQMHKLIYAEDALLLNTASKIHQNSRSDSLESIEDLSTEKTGDDEARIFDYEFEGSRTNFKELLSRNKLLQRKTKQLVRTPQLLCVALPEGSMEVGRLELSRKIIFNAVREGFAAAYEVLVAHDPEKRGKGMEIAKEIWSDAILDAIPEHLMMMNTTSNLPLEQLRPSERKKISNLEVDSSKNVSKIVDFKAEIPISDGDTDSEVQQTVPEIEADSNSKFFPTWVSNIPSSLFSKLSSYTPYTRKRSLVRGVTLLYRKLIHTNANSTEEERNISFATSISTTDIATNVTDEMTTDKKLVNKEDKKSFSRGIVDEYVE